MHMDAWPASPGLILMARATVALGFVVGALFSYVLGFKIFHRCQARFRAARRRTYQARAETVFAGAGDDELARILKPALPGDFRVVEDVLLSLMRRIRGECFDRLQRTAFRLGVHRRHLARLHSLRRHARGRAMYVLGVLRAPHAIVGIIDILEEESLDLKLVALRALAAIGDPIVIPYFLKAAERVPPAMIVRLSSLLLEFGPPGAAAVERLVERHPGRFPPSVRADIARRTAGAPA